MAVVQLLLQKSADFSICKKVHVCMPTPVCEITFLHYVQHIQYVCKQEVVGSSPTGGVEFSSFFPFNLLSFLYLFLSFLYPFLCTSLHSALSGVESGASFAITEGPAH